MRFWGLFFGLYRLDVLYKLVSFFKPKLPKIFELYYSNSPC